MLLADKHNLQQELKLNLLHIEEKELNYYTQNCYTVGTQAALLAGFAFAGLVEVDDTLTDETRLSAHLAMQMGWSVSCVVALCLEIMALVKAMQLSIMGPGLALRGPEGSMTRAVLVMRSEYRGMQRLFYSGLVVFHATACLYVWMHFKWEAGLLITVVIVLALLYLWYDSRALNHRLRLPGPGHGSSWDPTTDSRNDWRGNSASNLNARMRDAHHAPDGGPISPSGAPRRRTVPLSREARSASNLIEENAAVLQKWGSNYGATRKWHDRDAANSVRRSMAANGSPQTPPGAALRPGASASWEGMVRPRAGLFERMMNRRQPAANAQAAAAAAALTACAAAGAAPAQPARGKYCDPATGRVMNLEADGLHSPSACRAPPAAPAAAPAKKSSLWGSKMPAPTVAAAPSNPASPPAPMTTDRRLSREKTTRELTADGSVPSRASLSHRHSWPNSPASNRPNGVKPEVSFREDSLWSRPARAGGNDSPSFPAAPGPRYPAAVSGAGRGSPAAGPNVEWTDRLMEAVAWPFNKFFDEAGADAPPTRENSNFNPFWPTTRAPATPPRRAGAASSKRTISCREVGGAARGCTFEMDVSRTLAEATLAAARHLGTEEAALTMFVDGYPASAAQLSQPLSALSGNGNNSDVLELQVKVNASA